MEIQLPLPLKLKYLEELMALLAKQTPSAPDWYRVVDQVVGTLLALEIDRLKAEKD